MKKINWNESNNSAIPNKQIDITECPLCNSDEFLLSDDGDTLICIKCGKVSMDKHTKQS